MGGVGGLGTVCKVGSAIHSGEIFFFTSSLHDFFFRHPTMHDFFCIFPTLSSHFPKGKHASKTSFYVLNEVESFIFYYNAPSISLRYTRL